MKNVCRLCLKPHTHKEQFQDLCSAHQRRQPRAGAAATNFSLGWMTPKRKCAICGMRKHGVMGLDVNTGDYGHLHCFVSKYGDHIGVITDYKVLHPTKSTTAGNMKVILEIDENSSDIREILTDRFDAEINLDFADVQLHSYENGSRWKGGLKLGRQDRDAVYLTIELLKAHTHGIKATEDEFEAAMKILSRLQTR